MISMKDRGHLPNFGKEHGLVTNTFYVASPRGIEVSTMADQFEVSEFNELFIFWQ